VYTFPFKMTISLLPIDILLASLGGRDRQTGWRALPAPLSLCEINTRSSQATSGVSLDVPCQLRLDCTFTCFSPMLTWGNIDARLRRNIEVALYYILEVRSDANSSLLLLLSGSSLSKHPFSRSKRRSTPFHSGVIILPRLLQ